MALANVKTVGPTFPNAVEYVRVTYEFAVDGGAVGDYDVLVASDSCIVKLHHIEALTSVTSGDAVVIDIGKGDGGTEFISDMVKAELAAGLVVLSNTETACKLAAGEKIVMGVETHAITAGKFEMVFEVMKAA